MRGESATDVVVWWNKRRIHHTNTAGRTFYYSMTIYFGDITNKR